jgi:ParB family transcriptional regulator, chromosome partitioning protein
MRLLNQLGTINLQEIPIERIYVSPENARTLEHYSDLDDLANSIKTYGLQQPIVVFPSVGRVGDFELIIGQRRFLAYKNILKEKTIPAIILKKPMNNLDALAYSFSENIHRLDLTYNEKIAVTTKLLKELTTVSAVAQKLNVSDSTVRNYLGWAAVPEPIKLLVEKKKISKDTAIRISRTTDSQEKAIAIAEKVVEIPRREDRDAIIETSIENPTLQPEQVFEKAKKRKYTNFTLNLTEGAAEALESASKKFDLEPEQLVIQVLLEYLKNGGFFQ